MVANAERTVELRLPPAVAGELMLALEHARLRGCRVLAWRGGAAPDVDADPLLLLADSREALVGLLTPAEFCQAVTSANPALVAAVRSYFVRQVPARAPAPPPSTATARGPDRLGALRREERKHRRLIGRDEDDDAA